MSQELYRTYSTDRNFLAKVYAIFTLSFITDLYI